MVMSAWVVIRMGWVGNLTMSLESTSEVIDRTAIERSGGIDEIVLI